MASGRPLVYVTLVDFVRSVWFSSSQRLLNYVAVHSVDLQKLVMRTKLVVYVFILTER
jgi:hypothetical protein